MSEVAGEFGIENQSAEYKEWLSWKDREWTIDEAIAFLTGEPHLHEYMDRQIQIPIEKQKDMKGDETDDNLGEEIVSIGITARKFSGSRLHYAMLHAVETNELKPIRSKYPPQTPSFQPMDIILWAFKNEMPINQLNLMFVRMDRSFPHWKLLAEYQSKKAGALLPLYVPTYLRLILRALLHFNITAENYPSIGELSTYFQRFTNAGAEIPEGIVYKFDHLGKTTKGDFLQHRISKELAKYMATICRLPLSQYDGPPKKTKK